MTGGPEHFDLRSSGHSVQPPSNEKNWKRTREPEQIVPAGWDLPPKIENTTQKKSSGPLDILKMTRVFSISSVFFQNDHMTGGFFPLVRALRSTLDGFPRGN